MSCGGDAVSLSRVAYVNSIEGLRHPISEVGPWGVSRSWRVMIGQSWETSKQRAGDSELLSRLVSASMTRMGRHFRAVADTSKRNRE